MKLRDLRLVLPMLMFTLIVLFLASCAGITPGTPTPSPGTTVDDVTAINGQIKMPLLVVSLQRKKQTQVKIIVKPNSGLLSPGQ